VLTVGSVVAGYRIERVLGSVRPRIDRARSLAGRDGSAGGVAQRSCAA
jgi:hypothetical protein